jgi:hypothetical protein
MEQQLSNIQIELLKLYSNNVPDDQLYEIKLLIGKYFAKKTTQAMDKVWNEKKLTDEEMKKWSHEHNRIAGGN